jgi:hypothetical protein
LQWQLRLAFEAVTLSAPTDPAPEKRNRR